MGPLEAFMSNANRDNVGVRVGYRYSQLDNSNFGWFKKDVTRNTLLGLSLAEGSLRGLSDFKMEFAYPISAIAGVNGSGKSTILAMVACAFHNKADGFKLPTRDSSYYTFGDFFVQSAEEVPPEGIRIECQILSDQWAPTPEMPDGKGAEWQERVKPKGGKWNNYRSRVDRNVIFAGLERFVPHSERSTSRTYRKNFQERPEAVWEADVRESVGRVLGRKYESLRFKAHSYYRLAVVKSEDVIYSGFNMGAGENVLFDIFSWIYSCPKGVMLVVDEIELGLHEQAQIRFIEELKAVCLERKAQVVCTTHSPTILSRLPPEARFFVSRGKTKTKVTRGISPAFAAGLMAGSAKPEITVLVEDEVARTLVEVALGRELRLRSEVIAVGSANSVMRHLATRYKEKSAALVLAILDGDQEPLEKDNLVAFCDALETAVNGKEDSAWAKARLQYLPGEKWPEQWVLSQDVNAFEGIAAESNMPLEDLTPLIIDSLGAGKHKEFKALSGHLALDIEVVRSRFTASALAAAPKECERLRLAVESCLKDA